MALNFQEMFSGESRGVINLTQCHDTSIQAVGKQKYFVKGFKPYSYEITNEVNWLTSALVKSCRTFSVPGVIGFSVKSGKLVMEHVGSIEVTQEKAVSDKLDALIGIAAELHMLIVSKRPFLKYTIKSSDEYAAYLKEYISVRIRTLSFYELNYNYLRQVIDMIGKYSVKHFTVVHRDLRVRHLIWPKNHRVPFLVDWEYANMGDPAQDIAKVIYEHAMGDTDKVPFAGISQAVLEKYYNLTGMKDSASREDLKSRVAIFLPVISLENASSLEMRKPTGYRDAILKEIDFINSLYDYEKH